MSPSGSAPPVSPIRNRLVILSLLATLATANISCSTHGCDGTLNATCPPDVSLASACSESTSCTRSASIQCVDGCAEWEIGATSGDVTVGIPLKMLESGDSAAQLDMRVDAPVAIDVTVSGEAVECSGTPQGSGAHYSCASSALDSRQAGTIVITIHARGVGRPVRIEAFAHRACSGGGGGC
jgi:hypothetical protein